MPEEALLIAVLEDAIDCVCKCRSAPDKYRQRRLREEQGWFMSEANDRPFAFERVCEVLGLDAGSVRSAVLGDTRSLPAKIDGEVCNGASRLSRETPRVRNKAREL